MAKPFEIEITSPDKNIYRGQAEYLTVPAAKGYMGVLANHAPLVASLVPGNIVVREGSGHTVTFVSKGAGFIEVLRNKVKLLVDTQLEKSADA
jgi:F-type H+-transporting ATPase subunit epsilon